MKESLKMLIRRRAHSATDSDPLFRAFFPLMSSCSRPSNGGGVKDSLILPPRKANPVLNHEHEEEGKSVAPPNVEEEETDHQINLAEVMSSSMQQHPPEPLEIDEPIRCPPPEPSIIQDNRALRGHRRLSTERSGQLRFLTENEFESFHETSKHAIERSRDPIVLI